MDKEPVLFEAIASSLDDARTIEASGGQRIELVSALSQGGFTPSLGLVKAVLEEVSLPLAVMLRPNKTDFHYSPGHLEEMRRDALLFWKAGVRHIVLGLLDQGGIVDIQTLEQVLRGTDFQVTFHRAIDETSDIAKSLERINACPRISHILTSLGQGQVIDNLDRLPCYKAHARPKLILASGVTHKNAGILAEAARRHQCDIHVGTALRQGKAMNPVDPDLTRAMAHILGQA
ncbi:MAG TPA: copper homeostasis protein CutC [Clostridia bacterium]|nr:copper homeostasis protein CutC [Clostridia bacterium]